MELKPVRAEPVLYHLSFHHVQVFSRKSEQQEAMQLALRHLNMLATNTADRFAAAATQLLSSRALIDQDCCAKPDTTRTFEFLRMGNRATMERNTNTKMETLILGTIHGQKLVRTKERLPLGPLTRICNTTYE